MKAIVKATEQAGSLALVDVPIPEPGPGQVLVQIRSASVCYSDVSILNNKYIGRKPVPIPLVMGHEGSGVIAALGPGVTQCEVGQRVAVEPIAGCGHCSACQTGFKTMCADWRHIGITCNGTFAEYVCVSVEQAHRIPDSLSFAEAALLEPLALVVRSLEQSKPLVGETVAILGPGALGIMHLLAYKAAGASTVILVGLDNDRPRLDIARELGADHVVNIDRQDPVQAILDVTNKRGADIVVETANSPKATQMAFNVAGPRGRVVLFGLYPEATISPVKMLRNGLTVYGDVGAISRQFLTAIRWMESGKVNVRPLISKRFSLTQCVEAFEVLRRCETVKIVFEM